MLQVILFRPYLSKDSAEVSRSLHSISSVKFPAATGKVLWTHSVDCITCMLHAKYVYRIDLGYHASLDV